VNVPENPPFYARAHAATQPTQEIQPIQGIQMTQTALEVHFGSPSGLGQAGLGQAQPLLYTGGLAPIVYSGRPIGINSTKSSSTSVGAREVGSGGEGLYGRPVLGV
jgi:hypothetical protein